MKHAIAIPLIALAAWVSVAAAADQGRHRTVEKITVGSRAMVGFVPPPKENVPEDEVDADREMRFHVASALEIAGDCLRSHGVDVVLVQADVIELESGHRAWRLEATADGNQGVGAYLVSPGKEPKLLRCSTGPSALEVVLPVIGPRYLGFPECVPEEWRDWKVSDHC